MNPALLNPERPYTPTSQTWTTSDEIEYLNGIGSHTVHEATPQERLELLEAYGKALKLRPKSTRFLNVQKIRDRLTELMEDLLIEQSAGVS